MPIRCRIIGDDGDVIARFDVSEEGASFGECGPYADRNVFCATGLDDPLDEAEFDDHPRGRR
jgi:hypothetical protein